MHMKRRGKPDVPPCQVTCQSKLSAQQSFSLVFLEDEDSSLMRLWIISSPIYTSAALKPLIACVVTHGYTLGPEHCTQVFPA